LEGAEWGDNQVPAGRARKSDKTRIQANKGVRSITEAEKRRVAPATGRPSQKEGGKKKSIKTPNGAKGKKKEHPTTEIE